MAVFTLKHGDRTLEGYTIQRGVGRGGFGEVYYAVSDGGREVALKYLRDNPAIELRGVSHCMNLKSPHLVTIFDVKQNADGEYFIVMEYVQGPSLRDLLIAEPDGLGPQKAAFFIRELAKGLGYLHDRGIVHRDMKPGNIFYEDGYVKIGDYGLSKFISVSRHSAQTASIGTVHYMAPEVGSGNYHRGIDIYALGVILYEMLLGRVPYDGATMGEVLMKHLTAQPEVDELPEPFGRVIRKALAKDPNDRYQTVEEMAEDVLGVDEVKHSLAGFSPRSLTAVAVAPPAEIDTPRQSPNPPPPPPRVPKARIASAVAVNLPGKLGQRFDRVGAKIHRRMEQLERKHGTEKRRRWVRPGAGQAAIPALVGGAAKSYAMGGTLVLAIALGLGMLFGFANASGELGASAGMGVLAMCGGVLTARRVGFWMGKAAEPTWVKRLVLLGCSAPLLVIAMAPTMAAWITRRHDYSGGYEFISRPAFPNAPMALLALAATAMFVRWEKRLESGSVGEMKAGRAFSAGLFALIATAILTEGRETLMFLSAGIAAAGSLALQGVAWFVPLRGLRSAPPPSNPAAPADDSDAPTLPLGARIDRAADRVGKRVERAFSRMVHRTANGGEAAGAASAAACCAFEGGGGSEPAIPMALPVEQNVLHARLASADPLPPSRHTATRAFWSVLGFLLLAGAVVSFLSTVLLEHVRHDPNDRQIGLTVCVVCCAMLAFVVRKTSLRRRPGFWRETLRPFLLSLTAGGIGTSVVPLFTRYDLSDEAQLGAVTALVLSSVLFLVLLLAARSGPRRPAPFLQDAAASGFARSDDAPRHAAVDAPAPAVPPADDAPESQGQVL